MSLTTYILILKIIEVDVYQINLEKHYSNETFTNIIFNDLQKIKKFPIIKIIEFNIKCYQNGDKDDIIITKNERLFNNVSNNKSNNSLLKSTLSYSSFFKSKKNKDNYTDKKYFYIIEKLNFKKCDFDLNIYIGNKQFNIKNIIDDVFISNNLMDVTIK